MPERATRRLSGDAGLVLLSRVAGMLVVIALTPFVVAELGQAGYGVWIVVSAMTGLFGVLDAGLGPAVARVVARAVARGDGPQGARAAWTAIVANAALGTAVVLAGWWLVPELAEALRVPDDLAADASSGLRLALVAFVLTNVAAVFESVLIGHGRFGSVFATRALYAVAFGGCGAVALAIDPSVTNLVAGQIAGIVLALALGLALTRRALLLGRGARPSRAALSELLHFGLPQQVSRLAYLGAVHYERILVGVLVGGAAAGAYGAASVLVASACTLLAQATIALLPGLARAALGERAEFERLSARASFLVALPAGLVFGVLVATAAPLLGGWLGPEFTGAARYVYVLAPGLLAWTVVQAGFVLVQAHGKPRLELRGAVVALGCIAIAAPVVLASVGEPGIAVATSASLIGGGVAFVVLGARDEPLLIGAAAAVSGPVVVAAVLACLGAVVNERIVDVEGMGRLSMLALAGAEGACFAGLYAAALSRLPATRRWRPGRLAVAVAGSDGPRDAVGPDGV